MLLTERREISFGPLALRYALGQSGAAGQRLGLPPGVPSCVQLLAETQEVVVGTGEEERRLSATSLAAALISYCMRAGIALPREARKAVRVAVDGVTLIAVLEYDSLPEPRTQASAVEETPRRQMVWGPGR